MDEDLVRQRFEDALETYAQEFGTFFIARMLGPEIT